MVPEIHLLTSPNWTDYELLDSGDGQKLERFGPYTFIRPEVQAIWSKSLSPKQWQAADATFQPSGEESGGHWNYRKKIAEKWEMTYPLSSRFSWQGGRIPWKANWGQTLRFAVMTTPGRHLGVFPECAAHWDWVYTLISRHNDPKNPVNVLNLFGYTGLASLACAAAGARVTHVDASKKSVSWAHANQGLSGLEARNIRWIVDDALKFVEREARRGRKYDGIVLDPPKFGRGPKGEVWEVYKSLPELLHTCRMVLSETSPVRRILTVYAVKLPAIHAYAGMAEMMQGYKGSLECGELVTVEKSASHLLSQAVFARWEGSRVDT